MKSDSFVKRHALFLFYALAFLISWGAVIAVIGPREILNVNANVTDALPVIVVAILLGPAVAGLVMTALAEGTLGLHQLWRRLLKWKVGWRWYGALLIAPLTVFGSLLLLSLVDAKWMPAVFVSEDVTSLLIFASLAAIVGGPLEELGWTGFATPRWLQRHTVLWTGVIMGVIWGVWHLIVNFPGSATAAGELPIWLHLLVALFAFLVPYRTLMVWVYEGTGSLLLAMLMHVSLIFFWLLAMPEAIAGSAMMTWYLVWGIMLSAVVAAVWLRNHWHWTLPAARPPLKPA